MFTYKYAAITATALALAAPALHAATLTFEGSYRTVATVSGYNPSGGAPLQTPLTVYPSPDGVVPLNGGLFLTLGSNERATVRYRVLGQESGFFNYLVVEGVKTPETDTGTTSISLMNTSGYLDFGFASNRQYNTSGGATSSIINGGTSEVASYKLGFGTISSPNNKSFSLISYFGDGTGDSDFDDIVASIDIQISAVPVPASLPMLIAGLGAFGWMRRKKKS